MKFWSSAEVHQPAFPALDKVRRAIEPFLNMAFEMSILVELPIMLRYVPVVMPEGMRERYPSRSRVRKKENLYDCAPQLDYEVFVEGTFTEQVKEYLRGVGLSAPHLAKLGASQLQIEEFKKILDTAADEVSRTGGGFH